MTITNIKEVEMKTTRVTTAAKTTFIIVVTLFAMAINTFAQNAKNQNPVFNEYAIKNINHGIQDDIVGIKKDCIYMAGYYKLTETVDALIAQLEKEKDPKVRVLISVSLLRIGDEEGMKAVYIASLTEKDPFALHMFKSVVYNYCSERNQRLSLR